MAFTISDAKTLAHSWIEETLDDAQILIHGNEFLRRIVSDKAWLQTTKAFMKTEIPTTDPTVEASGSGTISGAYKCKVTFVDADGGESGYNAGDVEVTADENDQFDWSEIPVKTGCNRKLYRTKADGDIYFYVATIADDTTTTYTDNATDDELTVPMLIKTKYTLPTDFYRVVKVETLDGYEYEGYTIGNRQISFAVNDNYIMTYVAYPAALTAITGDGSSISLPDIFLYPLAEFLIFKYFNIELDDGDSKAAAMEYEQRCANSLREIYSQMDIDSEGDGFQVKMRW
jgi:hypothetical protein